MRPTVRSILLENGITMPFAEQGSATGIPVIFLHAIGDSWHAFEPLLPHLPDTLRVYVPTLRGHGDASKPETGYHPSDFAGDVLAFVDALRLRAAILIGGSSGGFVARRFAMNNPERTLGLILLGSPCTLADKGPALALWESTVSRLADPIDPEWVRGLIDSTLAASLPRKYYDTVVRECLKVPARVWQETYAGLLSDDSFGELHRISAATLILWGERDALLPLSDQERLSEAIRGSRLVAYSGIGHMLYWEDPPRVAADVVAFIDTVMTATLPLQDGP